MIYFKRPFEKAASFFYFTKFLRYRAKKNERQSKNKSFV